jgi:hypothetical protein
MGISQTTDTHSRIGNARNRNLEVSFSVSAKRCGGQYSRSVFAISLLSVEPTFAGAFLLPLPNYQRRKMQPKDGAPYVPPC